MPTHEYRLKNGARVPGVTTIISQNLGWNKGALMHWAWKEGTEGRNYRDTKDDAAAVGTLAHEMVESCLKGTKIVLDTSLPPLSLQKAEMAYQAFSEFRDAVGLKPLAVEQPLVSEMYQYGGCIDIASIKEKRAIVDIKTSNGIYPDHWIQVSAYGRLWNENHPDEPVTAYYILRLGKEDGSFTYYYRPELEREFEVFLCLLKLNSLKKVLE